MIERVEMLGFSYIVFNDLLNLLRISRSLGMGICEVFHSLARKLIKRAFFIPGIHCGIKVTVWTSERILHMDNLQ
jgi:hypothetical protein